MGGFSIDWLNLREAADVRARDVGLLEKAGRWLKNGGANQSDKTVVDLGAGTGSTLRAFSTFFASIAPGNLASIDRGKLRWQLLDQDSGLLAEARRRHGNSHHLETHALDLADIAALPLRGADLITASALFDLVSADFIDRFVTALQSQCQNKRVGFYSALNYNGATRWSPSHPLDEMVLDAFNRDQRRNKGMGVALGPDAVAYMKRVFDNAGFDVSTASSPWELDERDSALVTALISGIGDAVSGDPALGTSSLQDWIRYRKAQLSNGTCVVGHTDLWVRPVDAAA